MDKINSSAEQNLVSIKIQMQGITALCGAWREHSMDLEINSSERKPLEMENLFSKQDFSNKLQPYKNWGGGHKLRKINKI